MPTYDYKCEKCGKDFLLIRTVAEHESKTPFCPSCKSKKVVRVLSEFSAKTSRKS